MDKPVPKPTLRSTSDVDPFPVLEAIRSEAPLVWDSEMGGWLVTSFELCKHIEASEDRFRHPYADAKDIVYEIKGGRRNVTVMQGPDHTRMHHYMTMLFSPKNIDIYSRAAITPVIDYLFDKIGSAERINLTDAVAKELPPRVLISLLGMDWRNDTVSRHVLKLHDTVIAWIGENNPSEGPVMEAARAAGEELTEIMLPIVRDRKVNPGNDFVSKLWSEAPGVLDDITETDILANSRELFQAGADTSTHSISSGFYFLATNPDLYVKLRADRGLVNNFVEEVLRLAPPLPFRPRVANQDCELEGQAVKKDAVLYLINQAANVDPQRFGCPMQIDVNRQNPRGHLTFNAGPRTCIGAPLARAELRMSVNAVLDRYEALRLDPDAEKPRFVSFFIRSHQPVNVIATRARDKH